MPPTPVPNLRRAEWLDRLIRNVYVAIHPKNRRRTIRRVAAFLATALVIAMIREAIHLSAVRLGWTPPPASNAERLGSDRVTRR